MADSERDSLAAMLKEAKAAKQAEADTQDDVQGRARERFRELWDAVPSWQSALRELDGDATVVHFLEDADADRIVPGSIDVFVNGKHVAFPFKIQGSVIRFNNEPKGHNATDLSQLLKVIKGHIVAAAT